MRKEAALQHAVVLTLIGFIQGVGNPLLLALSDNATCTVANMLCRRRIQVK
jgi:hypothetical protein